MTLNVTVEWGRSSQDGTASPTLWDDVTDDVRTGDGQVAISYGRDQSTAIAPTVSGSGSFTLDNTAKRYSPRNATSPLYGKLKPARPVTISRTVAGNTYTLFVGHTDDAPISPDYSARTVTFSLLDSLALFRGYNLSTPLRQGLRTGEAINAILDACNWSSDRRNIDPGATVIPWWWEEGTDAASALEKVLLSEGPPAMLTVSPNGDIEFRDRHHRLTNAASLTSQGTWRGSGLVEPVMQAPFTYDEAWRNIINTGSVSVDSRRLQELDVVWTSDQSFTLADGEQRVINVTATEPFMDAVTPVYGTDFQRTGAVVSARLIRTSGLSTGIELTATGGPSVVTGLRLRAKALTVAFTEQVSVSDPESITEYGRRSYPAELPWCSAEDARAILSIAISTYADPRAVVSTRFLVGRNTAKAAVLLSRDLGDRVRIIEPETMTNGEFFIESISHEFSGEDDHYVTFGLEAVRTQLSNVARADIVGVGSDQGVASDGLDDPSLLVLTDSNVVGRRVDEGLVAL